MNECEVCQRTINLLTDAHYAHTSGWAKARSQGGTNAISNPIRDGRLRCSTCMNPKNELEGQETLFG